MWIDRETILYWRRCDTAGLERLTLTPESGGLVAQATLLCAEDGGFRLDHRWELTPDGSARTLAVTRWGIDGRRDLSLERSGTGWLVDGEARPDLDGADEPDLSVTPFCNTFAIRRMSRTIGAGAAFDMCYVDGATLDVSRSRQRYERLGPDRLRYVDLGVHAGFTAELIVDALDLVREYQGLFSRVET